MNLPNVNPIETRARLTKSERVLQIFVITFFLLMPMAAQAEPWDDLGDFILDALTNGLSRTIAIIVCIGLGYTAFVGKLTWAIAGRFIAGIVFIFGAALIVDAFIGAVE